jgi:hypothetical protein
MEFTKSKSPPFVNGKGNKMGSPYHSFDGLSIAAMNGIFCRFGDVKL